MTHNLFAQTPAGRARGGGEIWGSPPAEPLTSLFFSMQYSAVPKISDIVMFLMLVSFFFPLVFDSIRSSPTAGRPRNFRHPRAPAPPGL
ncbi:MAG: hypothetical protein FWG46_07035 [Treponema sp.]|nr:hypothetical protein [Treponema sp.]